jgi:hypothetical protein
MKGIPAISKRKFSLDLRVMEIGADILSSPLFSSQWSLKAYQTLLIMALQLHPYSFSSVFIVLDPLSLDNRFAITNGW